MHIIYYHKYAAYISYYLSHSNNSIISNMEKQEPGDATTRKRAKQSISIPFVWEESPGTPKKDWKPTPPPLLKLEAPPPVPMPPPKYIASIPFKWEEKPGTPLPSFSTGQQENAWVCFDDDQVGDEIDVQDSSYPETCDSESDDSYTSAAPPSLMANGLVSTMAVSNAVPVCPDSPASETDSAYEPAGAATLAGASFLEWLFPLLTPQSKSMEKDGSAEISSSHLQTRKNDSIKGSFIRPQTLGELIMMSRRFSYQRNAVQMQMPNHPKKKFRKRNELVTSILETTDILGRLQKKWMRQLQLKLM